MVYLMLVKRALLNMPINISTRGHTVKFTVPKQKFKVQKSMILTLDRLTLDGAVVIDDFVPFEKDD